MTARITARVKPLPPKPTTLPSVLGPVSLEYVKELRDKNGVSCLGIWCSDERHVRLEAEMSAMTTWHTFWHEWVHIALWDGGVKLRKDDEERVCDAIATARVREMLDNGR